MANRRRNERPGQPAATRRETPKQRKPLRRPTMSGGAAVTSPEARRTGLGGGSVGKTMEERRNQGRPGRNTEGTGHYGRGARPVSPEWAALGYQSNQPVRVLDNPYPEDSGGFWSNLYSAVTAPGQAIIDDVKGLPSNIAGFFDNTGMHPNAYLSRFIGDQTFTEGTIGYGPFRQNAAGDWYGGPRQINVQGNIPGRPMPGVFQGGTRQSDGQQVFDDGTGNFYRYESDPRTRYGAVTPWSDVITGHGPNPYELDLWGYGYDTHQYGRDRLMNPRRRIEWVDDYPHIRDNPSYGDFSPSSYRYGPND